MKLRTAFLRSGCILPVGFDLIQEPLSEGWAEVIEVLVPELDIRIRGVGWHFMWITNSYSSRALDRTPKAVIRRAVIRALKQVQGRFNAAELDSFQITNCLGLYIAKVTLHARHIQKHVALDNDVKFRLQQALML